MKTHPTIGCCGIDCGLCPRFHTNGASACPGCDGKDFSEKHPCCGFVTCCVHKRGLETCAACDAYPCLRFEKEGGGLDSFVTHRRVFPNLNDLKQHGLEPFIRQQRMRMDVLEDFLKRYDDGRSKSFYCLSCALLPVEVLLDCHCYANQLDASLPVKDACKSLKRYVQEQAEALNIELRLHHNP